MKKFLQLSFMLLFAFAFSESWAQERTVSGKVTSIEDGTALPGVNVVLKGTASGTVTDVNGNYSLSVPANGGVLVFSFIGLTTEEISIDARSVVDIQMSPDVTQLSEVVITGVGERSKASYAGSISTLGAEMIENKPLATIDQALQGNVAGLQLNASSGVPGSTQDIRIRGLSSITANNQPLFVIDGVPMVSTLNQADVEADPPQGTLGVLSAINSNDIESISVLKDATATALYGARGSNGVIIITTKKGKSGKAQFSFNAQYGFVDRAVDTPKMLNAAQYEELVYESLINAGYGPDADFIRENVYDTEWDGITNTDWFDEVSNDNAVSQQYDLSARGGGENVNYFASVGYFQQDGVNIASDFERITGKVNVTAQLSEKFSLSNSLTGSNITQNGQLENGAYFGSPEGTAIFLFPNLSPYNNDGTYNLDLNTGFYNPFWVRDNTIKERIQSRIINNTQLTYEIIPNLEFVSTLGLDYLSTEELYYDAPGYGDSRDVNGSSQMYTNRNFNYVFKNQLNYSLTLNELHDINVSAIYEAQGNKYKLLGARGNQYASEGLFYVSSAGNPDDIDGFIQDWYINSISGVLTYGFNDQIYVDASLRREGNSRFSRDNRWGTFYAIGASWVFTNSSFASNLSWLNSGKLRTSYGKTGNAGVGLNTYQSVLSFSGDYNGLAAVYPSQIGNSQLTWENAAQFNVGLDIELFERFTATVEYYNRRNYDLLLDVPVSRTTGFNDQVQNIGKLITKGVELKLNTNVIKKSDFSWNIGLNLTTVDNEVTKLPKDGEGQEIGILTSTRHVTEGHQVYEWYMPQWAGVNPETGEPLWLAGEEGNELTSVYSEAGDRYQGASALPTFYGGVNTNLNYKGIYFNANVYYSTGNMVYDTWASYTQSDGSRILTSNQYARMMDRWQKPGDISENPRNIYSSASQSSAVSTRRLYDGEYLRLRNASVGYQFPSAITSKVGLNSLNIYLQGTNLFTWVKDDKLEFDPEVKADGFLDLTGAPARVISLGLKANF